MLSIHTDEYFMKKAIEQAEMAFEIGEIPVGAIVVADNRIIAKAHNRTEHLNDVTAHAEIIAMTAAANHLGSKYLKDCTLFVTLEPCVMCAGALYWSQIGRVVFGAEDSKRGFMRFGKGIMHPKSQISYGVLSQECGQLMTDFFKLKR
ncbi:MAG: nucleoside deaminase [Saprospiraceae bacterium]